MICKLGVSVMDFVFTDLLLICILMFISLFYISTAKILKSKLKLLDKFEDAVDIFIGLNNYFDEQDKYHGVSDDFAKREKEYDEMINKLKEELNISSKQINNMKKGIFKKEVPVDVGDGLYEIPHHKVDKEIEEKEEFAI